jgi:hypothetical protein
MLAISLEGKSAACMRERGTLRAQVHGVDFYAGDELADPAAFELRTERARMLRAPRPEEGEQPDQAAGARAQNPEQVLAMNEQTHKKEGDHRHTSSILTLQMPVWQLAFV